MKIPLRGTPTVFSAFSRLRRVRDALEKLHPRPYGRGFKFWSHKNRAREDSNLKPTASKAVALSDWATAGLFVKFSVSAEGDEINGIGIYFFIHRTKISGNINTVALFVFSVERVIIEKWVKGIFPKNLDSLVCFSLVCVPKSPVSLVEISMKNNPHGFRWRYAIASSILSNTGEVFFPFL